MSAKKKTWGTWNPQGIAPNQGIMSGGHVGPAAMPIATGAAIGGPSAPQPEDPRITAYYDQSVKDASTHRDNENLNTQYDVTSGANDLGFNVNYDAANGTYSSDMSVDPSNPFSKIALLQRSYEQTKSGTSNSYASGGQLHSGAYGRMKASNQFDNDQSNAALRDALKQLLENARRARAGAADQYSSDVSGASTQALQLALGG